MLERAYSNELNTAKALPSRRDEVPEALFGRHLIQLNRLDNCEKPKVNLRKYQDFAT
jgi:hypothetical protein